MRRAGRFGAAVLAIGLLPGLFGDARAWARNAKRGGPALVIVADRVVGFVPFTVSIYGKVTGTEPGTIELCRAEVRWLTAGVSAGQDRERHGLHDEAPASGTVCAEGQVVRTPQGYDYARDMRFDRPGTYQVRVQMVDRSGARLVSNTVQVTAL